ncbi:hypothetical protein MUK42_24285 [Musa troglodytarum]|uniref:Secreted protein n=1 Tax=Musa troglodytarum TaxID=320322 RepID=A0A9E7KUK1_9LILI|nr:hypothetical protein MUK42_24285 [Musa troglodytarum]
MLMCTSSILDALITTLCLLSPIIAQHTTATLYSLLSIKVYRSIIESNKPSTLPSTCRLSPSRMCSRTSTRSTILPLLS